MLTDRQHDWAAEKDGPLDAYVAAHWRHPQVWCRENPGAYEDDDTSELEAAAACHGCPILFACREQALRQEAGAGESFGVRGGLTAAARQELITGRPEAIARVILPTTWSREEAVAHLAARGYEIKPNTWSAKATKGTAPAPVYRGGGQTGTHWDVREVKGFKIGGSKVNQWG